MRIYLDDERETPEGYVRCRWPNEVIELLSKNGGSDIEEISLDHDLGDKEAAEKEGRKEMTGYDVLLWIEEQTFMHGYLPNFIINIHSSNAVGIEKMWASIRQIENMLSRIP